jgi:ubiquinone/menaquinone biosynthesis C-methylase UbiE
MKDNWMQNFRKPRGFTGRMLLASMNLGHTAISRWGLARLTIRAADHVLDIGCGGGKNVARMLKRAAGVCGLDYSEVSVEKTRQLNRKAISAGRSDIRLGSVSEIPWPDNTFDIVTAFETVYFWPDFAKDIREIRRVLKPGGLFFICNEMNKPETETGEKQPYQYWVESLDLEVHTESEYRAYLEDAGFTDAVFVSGGKSALCGGARAKKE